MEILASVFVPLNLFHLELPLALRVKSVLNAFEALDTKALQSALFSSFAFLF